jgi:hypothetical protein
MNEKSPVDICPEISAFSDMDELSRSMHNRRSEEDPRTCVRRIAADEGISNCP